MRKHVATIGILGLAIPVFLGQSVPAAAGGWNYEAALYLWALGMDGAMTVRGRTGEVDQSFSDLVGYIDMALALHLEAGQEEGNLGWFVDVFWANLGEDFDRPPGEFDMDMAYVEGAIAYKMDENFQLFGGLRYTKMDATLDFQLEPPLPGGRVIPIRLEGDQSWTDLMLGGRVNKNVGEKWGVWFRFDVAGFGISNSSDFTLNSLLMGRRRFGNAWSFIFGYRIYDVDYRDDDAGFAMDVRQQGPVLALSYAF